MGLSFYIAPIDVCFSITSRCNLKCKHCLAVSDEEPDFESIKRIIDELSEIKVFKVAIFGGEPLVRKDFFKIVDYLNEKNFSLSLNTNGILLKKEVAEKLVQSGIRSFVISLDGSKPEIVENLRGKGVFERSVNGIKNAIEAKGDVLISCTVTKLNWKDLRNIAYLGKELKVSNVRFNNLFYTGEAIRNMDFLYLSPYEHAQLIIEIKKLKNEFGDFIVGSWVQAVEIIENWEKNQPPKEEIIEVMPCSAGTKNLNIRPDLKVSPCEVIWDVIVGDIKENSINEIWNNSDGLKKFREKIVLTREDIGECMDCIYRYYCYTGHRCWPYHLPGGIKNKNLFCILPNPPAKEPFFKLERIK